MSKSVRFRFGRADWVALSIAVARRPWHFRLATLVASLSVMVFVMAWLRSDVDPNRSMLSEVLSGDRKWWPFLGFLALFSAGMMFRHLLVGLSARFGYSSMPIADREIAVDLDADGVRASATDGAPFDWRFTWNDVTRLIETPDRLILATGSRRGLPIPRSAFARDADYERFRKQVLARLPKGVPHDRA